ncbi:hypothetical protein C8R45DRAFT_999748 [Mycena sanguinolenta]|nr:hypothetical protein C8R45DRAFT_999748 [Mycena sanguinolenta]
MLGSMHADRVRILDLEVQILDLEASISALRVEKALVQKRLDAYKYPVLTLPNEITSKILIHFLPIYPDAPPLSGLASPTSLTHVCRQWRQVALATPALWKAIKFDNHHIPPKQIGHIADAWIRRSGSGPLSIHIGIRDLDVLNEIFAEPSAMAIARWEHLRLCVPSTFLPTIAGPMPKLRSLDFIPIPVSNSDPFTFYDVPQLRSVFLYRWANVINVPWLQLTCLTLTYAKIDKCVRILTQTPNLVQCTLVLADGPIGVVTPDFVLPCLKSLVLETEYPHTKVGEFLQSFIVPSLCRLKSEQRYLGEDPLITLASFISRSGCRLEEVWITEFRPSTTNRKLYRWAFSSIPTFSFTPLDKKAIGEDDSEDSMSSVNSTDPASA